MQKRTTEWLENVNTAYHERQFKAPYRSTVAFCDWLEALGLLHKESRLRILDLGAGQGGPLYYMSSRYPHCTFVGVDLNPALVQKGNAFFGEHGITNCRLEVGDIYNLPPKYIGAFDGVISLQTLSWLPSFEEPLEAMCALEAPWMALSSLFYDGLVSCTIEVQEYTEQLEPQTRSFYNIYSPPLIERFLADHGYHDFRYAPFEIDIDLPRPQKKIMGTYTEKLANGRRLQISGPLLMPWYFISARRHTAFSKRCGKTTTPR